MASTLKGRNIFFNFRSTEFKFLIYFMLSEFLALGGIWIIYLNFRGLSLTQVAYIDIAFFGAIFLFEIPTGVIADKFGRKVSVFFAGITKFVGVLFFAFATTFTGFVISYIIWAIGITLSSGAQEAWLYDEIKRIQLEQNNENYEEYYQKIMGYLMTGASLSAAFAVIIGGIIAKIDITIPIILTAVVFLLSGIWALIIDENRVQSVEKTSKKTKEAFVRIFSFDVFPFVFIQVFISALVMSIIFWIQIYLDFEGVDYGLIGVILGISFLFTSIGSSLSSVVTGKTKHLTFVIFATLIGLAFLLMSILPIIGVVLGYYIIRLANRTLYPYFSRIFNSKIESKNRATAISVTASISTMFILSYELISARIIETSGFTPYFITTGLLLIIVAVPIAVFVGVRFKSAKYLD